MGKDHSSITVFFWDALFLYLSLIIVFSALSRVHMHITCGKHVTREEGLFMHFTVVEQLGAAFSSSIIIFTRSHATPQRGLFAPSDKQEDPGYCDAHCTCTTKVGRERKKEKERWRTHNCSLWRELIGGCCWGEEEDATPSYAHASIIYYSKEV